MKSAEIAIERFIFASRWIMAPFYLGLVLALGMLLVTFLRDLFHILPTVMSITEHDMILAILTLIDLSWRATY